MDDDGLMGDGNDDDERGEIGQFLATNQESSIQHSIWERER